MSGNITMSAKLNKTSIYTTGQPQLLYTLIEVQPVETLAQARLPLNFSLVLDKSGSMRGKPIRHLRDAVNHLIDQMQPDDIVSIVTFDNSARVVVPAQQADDKESLKKAVNKINSGGGTQMSAGMKRGLKELEKNAGPDRLSRIVLLTDGETSNAKACLNRADELAEQGIPAIALGLGIGWNEELLQDVAGRSEGRIDYIAEPQEIEAIFEEVWQSMQVVASNLTLTLRLIQGVEARSAWQAFPEIKDQGRDAIAGRAVTLPLAELEAGGQSLIVELIVPGKPAGHYRLAQAEVSYDIPQLGVEGEKVKADLVVNYTSDYYAAQQVDPQIMNLVERLTAYKLQNRALDEAAAGNIVGATQKLRAAATRLLEMGEEDLAQAAQQEADSLEKQGQMSDSGTRKLRYETRKLTQKLS